MDYSPELGGIIYQVASMARREGGISFAGGYPDPALFDTEGLAAAFNQVFRDSFRVALQYGEREGHPPLRARLAAFSSTPSRAVGAEELIIANGGQQGIETAVRVLGKTGDVVARIVRAEFVEQQERIETVERGLPDQARELHPRAIAGGQALQHARDAAADRSGGRNGGGHGSLP